MFDKREGEQELGFDPGSARRRRPCRLHRPHPLAVDDARGLPEEHEGRARERAAGDGRDRRALSARPGGLERASHVVILTWLHQRRRNLIVQKPRHAR